MNPRKKIDVEDLLSSYPAAPPPEDLAYRIHLEIPRLESVPTPTKKSRDPRRWLQAAALVVLVAGAVYAGHRLSRNARSAAPQSPEAGQAAPTVPAIAAPPETAAAVSSVPVREAIAAAPPRLRPTRKPAAAVTQVQPGDSALVESEIVDQMGTPLPGVRVQLTGEGKTLTTVTKRDGLARFPALAGGRYQVEVELPGAEKKVHVLEVVSGETMRFRSSLALAVPAPAVPPAPGAPTAQIESQVVDQSGSPLPGVTVTLNGEGTSRTVVTNASGLARFPSLQGGRYQVEAALAGFGKVEQVVQIASGETKQLQSLLYLATTAEVTVAASAPLLDVTSTYLGSNTAGAPSGGYYSSVRQDSSGLRPIPSTGGSREPNAQPYGDVFFQAYGTNPFVDTEEDSLSTFGLDVDTGSYGIARRFLDDGHPPPPEAIRVEEFVNSFDYGDAPPRRGDFAIRAEAAPSPYPRSSGLYRIVRFGIRARDVDPRDRKPATLVFVVDVSGSMNQENRLGLVKQALGLLLDRLRPSDRVGLVIYGTTAHALLDPTSDHARIRAAIDQLVAGGSTNAEAGLRVGYEMAARTRRDDGFSRVILCSDGVANEGLTGADGILGTIMREAKSGIELTTVGFGMGNYNDVLMEQLADKGNGRYIYVDTLREARRAFVENLTGTLQTIASDAKVQVEFDPSVVSRYRLLGYENRDIADEKFRDDRVDAGEIGAGHTVTAVYEIRLASRSASGTAATLRLRYRSADGGHVVEIEEKLRVREFAGSWNAAPRDLRLAALVAEFAEVLKKSYWARGVELSELARRIRAAQSEWPGDARVAELATLAERAAGLFPGEDEGALPED
jgi:Ca-activated chloride channel family protein